MDGALVIAILVIVCIGTVLGVSFSYTMQDLEKSYIDRWMNIYYEYDCDWLQNKLDTIHQIESYSKDDDKTRKIALNNLIDLKECDKHLIVGASIIHENGTKSQYEYLLFGNGTRVLTDCKIDDYPRKQNSTHYACNDGVWKRMIN